MKDKLTSQEYWENYYGKNHANSKRIIDVCSYYDNFWEQFFGTNHKDKTLIEIGGYPGRYLAYLADKYKVKPICLDYNSEVKHIEEVFKTMGVKDFSILQEDFTTFKTQKTYDFVLSNGFIEHFDDYDSVLDYHVDYMHDDSKLFVMIPNKRGYIRFYKYLIDYKNLKVHNLKCMHLRVFRDFADRNNLKINHLSYYGGFPISSHQELNFIQKLIYKVHRQLFKFVVNPYLMKHPSKYFSSLIIAIFEKK